MKNTVDYDDLLGFSYNVLLNNDVISSRNDGYSSAREAFQAGKNHISFIRDNYEQYANCNPSQFKVTVNDELGKSVSLHDSQNM